jgi:drug/metabolite transporter (DMT)-like permease
MVQMGACALLFTAGGSWSLRAPSTDVWIAIVITGVFASALAYFVQTWAQAHIDASRTALIIAMEPAWAVAASVLLAGQRFGLLQAAGAALVLAAIVGHELAPLKFKAQEDERIQA